LLTVAIKFALLRESWGLRIGMQGFPDSRSGRLRRLGLPKAFVTGFCFYDPISNVANIVQPN
jgi:hypothetical protein